jgi:hypothetical protein
LTVITTRPSATRYISQGAHGFTVVGGGGGAQGALNDDSDASYLSLGGGDEGWLVVRFGVPAVPTGAIITQDLIAMRLASVSPPDIPPDPDGAPGIHYEPFPFRLVNMWMYPSGDGGADPASTSPPEDAQHLEKKIARIDYLNTAPKTLYAAVASSRSDKYPLGFPHTNPELWMHWRMFGNYTDGYRGRLYEIVWGTQYVRQPTLTVNDPTGSVTDDDTPPIHWDNDLDEAGGGQTSFRWKAFDSGAFS